MEASNSIPFLDLITPHMELEEELTEVFRKALHTAGFIGGPMVEEFEQAFASSAMQIMRSRSAAERTRCVSL